MHLPNMIYYMLKIPFLQFKYYILNISKKKKKYIIHQIKSFIPITPSCWGAVYLTSGDLQLLGESCIEDITDACRFVDLMLGLSDL